MGNNGAVHSSSCTYAIFDSGRRGGYQAAAQACQGISDILPIPGDLSKIRLVVNEADAAKAEEILAAGFDQEEFDTESAKRRKKP